MEEKKYKNKINLVLLCHVDIFTVQKPNTASEFTYSCLPKSESYTECPT
jgi:hypothetical protein